MPDKNDFIKMFLAGVDWERKRGDKPAIKVAIANAISQIRVAEPPLHSDDGDSLAESELSNDELDPLFGII